MTVSACQLLRITGSPQPKPSLSPYALPSQYLNLQWSSLFLKRLICPRFRVWSPGQVPILPYDTMVAPLDSLTPRTGHPPQSGPNHPPQGESVFADGSGPLFSMYLQLAGEEDKKMTENWKGDADGILIFVSRHSASVPLYALTPRPKRLVCSLPLSRPWSGCPCRTSSQAPRTSQHSTSQISTRSSPIRMAPRSLFPPHFPIRPSHFLHQPLPYGSTRSGF